MRIEKVRITNSAGLHARAAAKLVEVASEYESVIKVGQKRMVDGTSILSLMMLAAVNGTELRIEAEGPDEKEAVNAVRKLIKNGFGETD